MADYIKREAAIETVSTMALVVDERLMIIRRINALPSADVKPVVRGRWMVRPREKWQTFDVCVCSNCKVVEYFNEGWKRFNFCPNCGSDMRGNDNECTD